MITAILRIGDILIQEGVITQEQLELGLNDGTIRADHPGAIHRAFDRAIDDLDGLLVRGPVEEGLVPHVGEAGGIRCSRIRLVKTRSPRRRKE